ncbi:MAG: SURF1 family protein [Sphingobium sp.]|nr:SURF1 family protein [Sphingobium sp.]
MTENHETQVRAKSLSAPFVLLLLAALLFSALGIWQVKRLAWKQDLIARVEQRVHAAPVAVPGNDVGPAFLADHEYQRVQLRGHYVVSGTALVRAVTTLGAGYWVLTPLKLEDGRLIYVNRGYVPVGSKVEAERARTPQGEYQITGLLRLPEPGGGFLRSNDAEGDKWYSRDIELLSQTRRLSHVAPFFVDAQVASKAGNVVANNVSVQSSSANQQDGPVPGLTVISFPNNHLSYALTWFAMAVLSAGMALWLRRRGRDL